MTTDNQDTRIQLEATVNLLRQCRDYVDKDLHSNWDWDEMVSKIEYQMGELEAVLSQSGGASGEPVRRRHDPFCTYIPCDCQPATQERGDSEQQRPDNEQRCSGCAEITLHHTCGLEPSVSCQHPEDKWNFDEFTGEPVRDPRDVCAIRNCPEVAENVAASFTPFCPEHLRMFGGNNQTKEIIGWVHSILAVAIKHGDSDQTEIIAEEFLRQFDAMLEKIGYADTPASG